MMFLPMTMNQMMMTVKQMVNRFKVGDKIRCLDDSGYRQLQEGKIYTVSIALGDCIGLLENNETTTGWFENRFVLVKDPKEFLGI